MPFQDSGKYRACAAFDKRADKLASLGKSAACRAGPPSASNRPLTDNPWIRRTRRLCPINPIGIRSSTCCCLPPSWSAHGCSASGFGPELAAVAGVPGFPDRVARAVRGNCLRWPRDMALVGVVREKTMKKPWLELTPQHELVIAEEVAFATQLAEQWQLPVLTTMRLMCSLGERYAAHSSEPQAIRWCLEHPDDYESPRA